MGRVRAALWLALVLILLTSAMSAQTSRGTVIGVVTDPSGAVVANAKVALTQQSTNVVREAVTNSVGFYRFDAVNLGSYDVKVTAPNFAAAVVNGIEVHANQISNADVKLAIGQSSQVVEVGSAADAVALQTTEQLRGKNIETRALADMPISGQNSLNLMTLAPGIVPTTLDGGGSLDSGIGSVNGARPRANNFLIDGVENNDISVAGPAIVLTNNDALAEVSVQTSNFSAEFGRTGGAVVNQVTKSGTNKLHGTAAWVYKSSALNASSLDERVSYFGGGKANGDPLKAPFLEHLPAFTVGGPVYIPGVYDGRNKTFFFVAGQWDRQNNGAYQKLFTVPTAAGIQTLRSLAATCPNAQLYLNSIGSMVAAARVGAADLSIPQAVYNVTGSCTNSTRAGMTLEYGTATRTAPVLFKGNTMQARVDHVLSEKHQVSFRFMSSPGSYPGTFSSGMMLAPVFDAGYNSSSYTGAITDTYVLTPHMTNELRLNYFRVGVDWPLLGGAGSLGATMPAISITGFAGLGTSYSFPQGRTFNNYQLQDTMTWVHGNHTLRYGLDINKQIARQSAPVAVRGALGYTKSTSPLGTTSAFSNFLDDFSGAGNNPVSRQFGTPIYHPTVFRQSYFVQDSWKLTPQLTVNLGLRYDYFGQPANGNFPYPMVSLDPNNYPNAKKLPVDRNNFGPTVGFAYNPKWGFFSDGKTVFRGGFQVGYDSWFNNLLSNMASAAPNNPSNLAYPATINSTTPRGVAGIYNRIFPALVAAPFSNPLANSGSQFSPNIVNPYTMHYSFGMQRELTSKVLMDVSYVGSIGRKLFVTRDLNPRMPNADGTAGARLNPLMGARTVRDSAGTSNYNSLQVEVRNKAMQTVVGGVTFNSAWTWSHNLDQVSEVFATSGGQSAYASSLWMSLNNLNLDYGNSDLDRRHRWVTSVIWDVRGPKHGVLNQVLGGWTIVGSIPLMSGTPFSVSNDLDRDGDGSTGLQDRPDIGNWNMPVTSRAILDDTCPAGLRNPDTAGCTTADKVFWVQSATRPGAKAARRNNVFSGGMISADVSFLKKFRIREGLNFEYRAEIFNIANHMNFNYPPQGPDGYGLLIDQDPGSFMNSTQGDYYTNPGYRSIRMGVKLIF